MLIEFRVENYRSIQAEQAFTFAAASIGDADDPRPRQVAGSPAPLLTVAAIYGANASGKSNVLSALAFMRNAVLLSHRLWDPEGGVPRDAFAWGTTRAAPSLFEVTFELEGVRFQYGFVCDDERILEEWLKAWPNGRPQSWFERDGDSFEFGDKLKGQNRDVQKLTRPNSLFLSAAVQNRHRQLQPLFQWFRSMEGLGLPTSGDSRGRSRQWNPLVSMLRQREQLPPSNDVPGADAVLELLQAADVGILDIKLDAPREITNAFGTYTPQSASILLRHQHPSGEAWLRLEQESHGTRTLLRIAPQLLEAISLGALIIVDELESSLHPLLALKLVDIFNSPTRNPRNAQLLFTTHDTNLLGTLTGPAPLRRDQVWLTEKDSEGRTQLYPLTDYKPRKNENLERGYLQGRYGAVPFLGEFMTEPPQT